MGFPIINRDHSLNHFLCLAMTDAHSLRRAESEDERALLKASGKGNFEAVVTLLQMGVCPNVQVCVCNESVCLMREREKEKRE